MRDHANYAGCMIRLSGLRVLLYHIMTPFVVTAFMRSDRGSRMAESAYALSIKQPWATLLLHGLKTIEVRSWATTRRGRILLHAARLPDEDAAPWSLLPASLREEAKLVGGLIGACDLTGCIGYRTQQAFAADQKRHLNEPSWFRPPILYGFTMANPARLPFRKYPGWVRFFPIEDEAPQRARRQRKAASPAPELSE